MRYRNRIGIRVSNKLLHRIDEAVENINKKREKDRAAGKKVSRKKMTRSSYVRMCVVDKARRYRRSPSTRR